MHTPFLAAMLALTAATCWGSGDFIGGLATRRLGTFRSILVILTVGMVALVILAVIRVEPLPPLADLAWGGLAGLLGLVGLGFLFRGFATGKMGIVAPVSAVLGTAIPVIFNALTEGLPGELQLVRFAVALVGIWLLARPESLSGHPAGIGMAVMTGLRFGAFFIALDQIGGTAVKSVREMKQEGNSPMRTIGSISLCRSFLQAGLVDRFRVVIFPVITGSTGYDRIYDGYPDVALDMIASRTFDGRLQLLKYVTRVLAGPPGTHSGS